MAAHTPGPWVIGKTFDATLDGYACTCTPISGSGVAVASIFHGPLASWAQPNAVLIAAAPDTLAALRGAADALSALAVSLPEGSEAQRYADDEARKCGAAIARAVRS